MPLETPSSFASPTLVAGVVPPDRLAVMALRLAQSGLRWAGPMGEDPERRSGLRLLARAEYDAWMLRWPPHTSVTPHDHGPSAGAFAVVCGELLEVRWSRTGRRTRSLYAGDATIIQQGVVHDVIAGPRLSVSVHLYSPALTTMSFYDASGREAVRHEPVDDHSLARAWTRALHPAGSR
jgi:hypothetical protein